MNFLRSIGIFLLAFVVGALMAEDVGARDLSVRALAKIQPQVLESFIHHGDRELIFLLDSTDIAEQARLEKTRNGLQFEDQSILKTKSRAYARLKNAVLTDFGQYELESLYDYTSLPMMFVRIATPQALYRLLENDLVERVFENSVHSLSLVQSLPLIGQPESYAGGHTGQGTTVAVLDTGVDYENTAFGSCVSPGIPEACSVVFAKDFAAEDGEHDSNGHGTNVAGIVVGVAPETRIAALDVFMGNAIYTADAIAAIDWVILNRAIYNIVAMNLSFGTDLFEHVCQDSWAATPFANARAVGVAPIVATGNDDEPAMVKNPACAPGAIRVGAVHDTKPVGPGLRDCGPDLIDADVVACFSNSADFLDLLAPGVEITAAGLTRTGTSMAAPHVVGAYAVLKGETAYPDEGIDSTIQRLKSTGRQIQDDRNGMVFPRVDLEAALFELLPDQVPAISSFEPVLAAEGQFIEIHGSGFRGIDEVLIGGTPAYDFTVNHPRLITVNLGSGSSGDIHVATSLGSDSMPGFTFINSVRESEPNNTTDQANQVIISGHRLAGGLSAQDDRDFFRFGFDTGQVSFGIRPVRSVCCSGYIQLELMDMSGNVLASEQVDESMTEVVTMSATINQRGVYFLVVSETPQQHAVFSGDYQITVPENTYTNTPPEFTSSPPDVVFAGQTYRYPLQASDADGDPFYYSLLSGPDGMVLDRQTNTITWRPNGEQAALNEVELMVFDDFGGSGTQTFNIAVIDTAMLQLSATDGTFKNHVRVSFNPAVGATVYRIFRCVDAGETCGTPVGFVNNGVFRDVQAVPGILYHYRVRICTMTKCGPLSTADTGFTGVAPARPTAIRATDGEFHDHVRVSFNPVDGAVRYRVFRCMDRGQTCGLPVGFPPGTSFDDTGGDPGAIYFYRVKACNSQHCGKFSVADPGHASAEAILDADVMTRGDVKPIPVLGVGSRGVLILMVLGLGFFCGYRANRAGKLDLL